MVNFQFYDPSSIFQDGSNPEGMAGKANVALATSFYHSRHFEEPHECNNPQHTRHREFDRNAGAVQLYKEDGINTYQISEKVNNKEYHFISYGNKNFKRYTSEEFNGEKVSSYGHSERMLMRDILDDLISADKSTSVVAPSKCPRKRFQDDEYLVLKYLTDNAAEYKEYLKSKKIIVKMWSERPACSQSIIGGDCIIFMKNICPEGSQFGFIIKDYVQADNSGGAPKVVNASRSFKMAYEAYIHDCKSNGDKVTDLKEKTVKENIPN